MLHAFISLYIKEKQKSMPSTITATHCWWHNLVKHKSILKSGYVLRDISYHSVLWNESQKKGKKKEQMERSILYTLDFLLTFGMYFLFTWIWGLLNSTAVLFFLWWHAYSKVTSWKSNCQFLICFVRWVLLNMKPSNRKLQNSSKRIHEAPLLWWLIFQVKLISVIT